MQTTKHQYGQYLTPTLLLYSQGMLSSSPTYRIGREISYTNLSQESVAYWLDNDCESCNTTCEGMKGLKGLIYISCLECQRRWAIAKADWEYPIVQAIEKVEGG